MSAIERKHVIIDAKDKILGRVASQAAFFLVGKDRTDYIPNIDKGGVVIIKNAGLIRVSGDKEKKKIYYRFSGYPGGVKAISLGDLKEKNPVLMIKMAIYNMLPKNKLRPARMKRLKLTSGEKS